MTDHAKLATRLDAAYAAYRASIKEIALLSVTLIAEGIRESLPNAKSVTLEWSDQGDFLSLRHVDDHDYADEALDDLTEYAWNLSPDNSETWGRFLVSDGARQGCETYTMDLDLGLTAADTEVGA